eukprot:384971_1
MGTYFSVNAWCLCTTVMLSSADKTCSPSPTIPETCIIDQLAKYTIDIGDFDCGSSYKNCIITCGDTDRKDSGCSDNNADAPPYIKCPNHPDCNQCVVNCDKAKSCRGLTIYGYNCNTLQINIRDSDQKEMDIYAPGNNGNLVINTQGSIYNKMAKFKENKIFSSSKSSPTNNMIFNLNDGDDCTSNIINASYISGDLNFQCTDTCDFTVIDATHVAGDFNYLCSSTSSCSDTTIIAQYIQGNIDIKCTDNAICSVSDTLNNYGIDTRFNKGNVTFTCDQNANCNQQQIYCPNDYNGVTLDECRIFCNSNGLGCSNVDVFGIEGIYDVKWECMDGSATVCDASTLHCGDNYSRNSLITYTNPNWHYSNTDCAISPSPSTAPTTPPTNSPSLAPTSPPSRTPTSPPSIAPTLTPTKSPSFTPTIPPSIAPTNNPSLTPTFIPSKAPTLPPSKAPTSPPSVFPTTAPSYSPTACIDANHNISSVDGYEENINDKIFNLHFNNIFDVNKKIISDKPGQFYGYKFSNLSNDNKQELICSEISSCLVSTIIFENNSICHLKCNETLACSNSIVNMTECAKTHIICNGIDACNSMYVSISTNNNYEIDIQCGMKSSCNDMVIDMTGNGLSNIQCIDLNACDGLQIYIEPKYYKNNYLHLFSHSNDVLFSNGFGYEEVDGSQQYIKCNTKDQFIRWNDSVIYTNELLEPLILNEYTNNLFPCSGVTVECFQPNNTNNTNNTIEISDCAMNFAADISDFNITSTSP